MEKYHYRRCQKYTMLESTPSVEIDVEKLKICNPPYEGESEYDLLEYIQENIVDNFYDWSKENREVYGDDIDSLCLESLELETYYDSRFDYSEEWFEVGTPNPDFTDTGEFEVLASSNDE